MIFPFFIPSAESDENDDDSDVKDGVKKEGGACTKQEKDAANASTSATEKKECQCGGVKTEKDAQRAKESKTNESELVRDLRNQLK